jgi:hypothetical protein
MRCHGVFAPNSDWRAPITAAGRGRGRRSLPADATPSAGEQHRAMRWAQRLKRVYNIDIEACPHCGRPMKVAAPAHPCARGIRAFMHSIASIEDPAVINTTLARLDKTASRTSALRVLPPAARAPPTTRAGPTDCALRSTSRPTASLPGNRSASGKCRRAAKSGASLVRVGNGHSTGWLL